MSDEQQIYAPCCAHSVVEGTPEHVDEDASLVGHFTVSGLRRLKKGVLVMLAINGSGILEVCLPVFLRMSSHTIDSSDKIQDSSCMHAPEEI